MFLLIENDRLDWAVTPPIVGGASRYHKESEDTENKEYFSLPATAGGAELRRLIRCAHEVLEGCCPSISHIRQLAIRELMRKWKRNYNDAQQGGSGFDHLNQCYH